MIDRTVLDIYSFMYSWMLPKTVTESAPVRFFYLFEIFRCHWRFDLKCQGVRQLDLSLPRLKLQAATFSVKYRVLISSYG